MKKKKRNINIISQFITDSLRQYPFMCVKEDKYAFDQFYIVIIFKFSHSFFDDQLHLMTENRFGPLSNDRNVRLSSNNSKETIFSSKTLDGLKLISQCFRESALFAF